jgi:amino acid transporter
MAVVEYAILIGMSIWGLFLVLGHHVGTVHVTSGWFSLTGVSGKGDIIGGFLIAVFAYSGWDGTVYVNEEVKHRRVNPGRAAVFAVIGLIIIYTLAQVGLQGVTSMKNLQANADNALVYVAQVIGGNDWAKVMALALLLSVIATTGTGIVVGARIIYGMASYRALPEFLANVPRRFQTPAAASILMGFLVVALAWIYLLATSVENAFDDVVAITGLLFAIFYVLTALAAIIYYRRRIMSNAWDMITVGLLPLASAGFLAYMVENTLTTAPAEQVWSIVGIVVAGLVLMLIARFVLRSWFFEIQRESAPR